MQEEVKGELIGIFGDRVAFHDIERMLYSSDVASLPAMVKNRIATVPDAVVQPKGSDELEALVKLATKYKLPLVPRGAGTAGYGGAVPTKGGIVVDFSRMKNIVDISTEKKTAVVGPGVVWNELEAELRAHGLALRLYPGSAISATVGGWIANGGGIGIGSYEYGYIRDNIVEVEIITPSGTKNLTGDDLDLVYGLAGATGFISRVTLKVRDSDDDIPVLGAFSSFEGMVGALEELAAIKLPLWDVSYKDPQHIKLTHKAVKKQAEKFPVHHETKEPWLPEDKFIVMFVYPAGRDNEVRGKLLGVIEANGGELLSEELAKFEWDERFYAMRLKALGPSMIPSEVIVPTVKLSALIGEIKRKIKRVAWNGTLINHGSEAVVFTYLLDDERRRGFTLANSRSFVPIKAAMKLGGRVYAIGMILTDMAEQVMGKDRLLKAYEFKKEVDPDGIMNPGKVFPTSLDKGSPIKRLEQMMKLARRGEGALRAVDKLFGGDGHVIGQKTALAKLPFGEETQGDAFACANCGYCRTDCTLFNAVGWESASPRGKYHFLREYLKGNVKMDQRMAELFSLCTTCRRCNEICQVKSPIDEDWGLTLRPATLKEGYQPPVVYQRAAHNVFESHNAAGVPSETRTGWVTPDLRFKEEGELVYWAGCQSSFVYTMRNVPINGVRILNKAGIEPVYLGTDEWCCGAPMFTVGTLDETYDLIRHNVNEMKRRGIKTLVTSCPGCWITFAHYYTLLAPKAGVTFDIKIRHIVEVFDELIDQGKIKFEIPVPVKLTYHDSCHIGRGGGMFEQPRKILKAIPGLELIEMPRNRENSACCGKHVLRYPGLTNIIHKSRVLEAEQTGADAIVIACPTCEANFRIGVPEFAPRMEVLDISDPMVVSMGLPLVSVSKLHKILRKKLVKVK
jgi:Fe-S oxidoreductase/FAD/FMN-containing dehydrogenase